MKERKESVDLMKANQFCFVLALVAVIVFGGISLLVWKELKGFSKVEEIIFLPALIAGIVIHELIHGITWSLFCKNGFKSIKFGVMWKMLSPYCHCSEPLKRNPYLVGGLMPLILLGLIPALIGIAIGDTFMLVLGIVFTAVASGDVMVAWRIRSENPENEIYDNPNEVGYIVYDKE